MSRSIVSIGVDLGGTWVRVAAVDPTGRLIRLFKAPAPTLGQLPTFLNTKLHAWKTRPTHLIAASRGVWTPSERKGLKHALRRLARRVTVMSDVEAAWHAAFSSRFPLQRIGIVVIAGTGSIAFGRDAHGRTQRAGGWGPLLGDEGSAFWIGKTWLKRTHGHDASARLLHLVRTPHHAVQRIASLVPSVLGRARQGNPLAKQIVKEAQQHLAALVVETARRLRLKRNVPVSWGGSVLNNVSFRSGFLKALKQEGSKHHMRFEITPPGHSPVLAIARLR